MKKIILTIVEFCLSIIMIPMYFINLYSEVSVLPGYNGNGDFITVRQTHYYNAIRNLKDINSQWMMYIHFALIGACIILGILNLIFKNNKMIKYSNIICFTISILFFIVTIFIALTLKRNY